jgi:hypothetical protein
MKRPPGRPPLDASATAPSADVHLVLPAKDYDKVEQLAKKSREKLHDTIRRAIKRFIEDERG